MPISLFRNATLLFAFILPAMTPPAAAQRMAVQAGRWNLDYGDIRCSLSRRLGGPQSPILILSSYLGRDEPEIILMNDGDEALPNFPGSVQVTLLPGNHVARGVPQSRRVQGGRIVNIRELGEGFIDRVAEAQAIRVEGRGRTLFELALPQTATAVAALKECNEDLLRSWGVDTAVPISRRPRHLAGSINDRDYPSSSISAGERGSVVARFLVRADGRVQGCAIAVSSTFATLDIRTCELITERFRYEPAVDDQGRPVTGLHVQTVRWMLPDH